MVLGWLTRLALVLAVVGVLALDALSWTSARVGAQDSAEGAARTAATTFQQTRQVQRAYDAALAQVAASGDTIDASSFRAAPDGVVTLTLRREASTIVLHRIAPLRHWTQLSATVASRPAG